ncbi:MAG: bifunctional diguanylate cyclase/phosphodiesterase [Hyphomicrobiaceae bacterium]|nr:bifunctional diguanylate cyclase/phosphodiesterase [Hyphomicrobiaceae bacterium]
MTHSTGLRLEAEGHDDMETTGPGPTLDRELLEAEAFDLVELGSDADETAYVWDLASDRIQWEPNAAMVLGLGSADGVSTGTLFNSHIAPEHVAKRVAAICKGTSPGDVRGVPYRLQFRFRPQGLRGDTALWLEDHGRWWPDRDGKPSRARGVIRVVDETFVASQRKLYGNDRDELTGQLNRHRLTEALEAVIDRSRRSGSPAAFLMVAVNNLSVVNETFGFTVGDEVLQTTASLIRAKLRGGDAIGRYSSNKFGIVLNDCGPGAMRIAAERFMKAVRSTTFRTSACQLSATISIGGVALPDYGSTARDAINASLLALEKAKSRRFDCFISYTPDAGVESQRARNIQIADELMSALDQNRLRLMLQPMISAKTGEAMIHECLLRLERPDGSLVSAGEFIAVAEQIGLSRLIDQRVLELATAILDRTPDIVLSVNISGLTAVDKDWLAALTKLTASRPGVAERLIIEITETSLISDLDQAIAFADTLKELGCRVAIDDFGAGYTSFKNLKHLPVDLVKIDGTFVKSLSADAADLVFIRTMVEIADTFGMETVAEWVGDEECARLLTEAGITYLQGFHYGQPFDPAQLAVT